MPFPNSHHTLNQLAKCTDWKFNFETNDSHCVTKCSCLYLLPSAFQSHQLLSSPWTPLKACRQRQLRLWRAWMAFSLSLSGSIVDCKSCMLLQIAKKDWACVNIHSLCGMSRGIDWVVLLYPRWVAYEYSHFQGRQLLLQTGEYSMWGEHSGWDTLGSLQALGRVRSAPMNRMLWMLWKFNWCILLNDGEPTCGSHKNRPCLPHNTDYISMSSASLHWAKYQNITWLVRSVATPRQKQYCYCQSSLETTE